MTFFDELKRNASMAADKAAKKTNELTAIAKLNINIKNSETKLNATFEEIGRLFYSVQRTGEDFTSDIAAGVMKADKIRAEIIEYRKQLAALKKVTECPGCGTEIDAEALFCPHCGMKQEKPADECDCGCCCECGEEECDCDCECGCCEEEKAEECDCGCDCSCDCGTEENKDESAE